jgi:hypothetical protein
MFISALLGVQPVSSTNVNDLLACQIMHATSFGGISAKVAGPAFGM